MSIFSRLTDIINSNISAALDRAEDPEKMVRLMIQEMEDTLVDARSHAARLIAQGKEFNRAISGLEHSLQEWEQRAETALDKGREDLARAALIEKQNRANELENLYAERDKLLQLQQTAEANIQKLTAKLLEAKAKRTSLIERQHVSATRQKVAQQVHSGKVDEALNRFERMETRIDSLEAEAELLERHSQQSQDLAGEIANLEKEAVIDDALAALKAKRANLDKN